MAAPITNITVTPQDLVLFEKPNILVSPRLEVDQQMSRVAPQGKTYISKNNDTGHITITQNGTDYIIDVRQIVQVGIEAFTEIPLGLGQQEENDLIQKKTILIYNALAYNIFKGCCECEEGGGGSGTREYQLGGLNSSTFGRTTYTSFLGSINSPTTETDVLAPFREIVVLQKFQAWFQNSCSEDAIITIRKNGIDTAHTLTIPAGVGGYYNLEGINETYSSTDTFSVKLTIPDTATGFVRTITSQGSLIIVQTATSGNPFGVMEVLGETVDNDDPSIQYPKVNVFEPITREELLAKIAASEVKIRAYRMPDALHEVISGIDIYSTIQVYGISANEISILADNFTTDEVGQYNIGTTGNNDDTFTPQGGGGTTTIWIEKTYAEATALISSNDLEKGALYKITESTQFNNAAVYIQALEDNEFEATGTAELYFPKYNRAVAGYDIWSSAGTYTAGNIRYWGHQAWENLTGAAGTEVDRFELDGTNWALFPSTDVDWADHYDRVLYPVTYDFANNRIIEMDSMKGSKVTVGAINVTNNLTDPIMNYPWNNDYSGTDAVGVSYLITSGFGSLLNFRGVSSTGDIVGSQILSTSEGAEDDFRLRVLNLADGSDVQAMEVNDSGLIVGSIEVRDSQINRIITDVNIYKVKIFGINANKTIDFTGGTVCQDTPMDITQDGAGNIIATYYNSLGTFTTGSPND